MTTVWFPHAKASEVGKLFIEASKKFPEDKSLSKSLLNNAVAATKEGYKVVSASEIKEGKLNLLPKQINSYFFSQRVLKAINIRTKSCPQLSKQWIF